MPGSRKLKRSIRRAVSDEHLHLALDRAAAAYDAARAESMKDVDYEALREEIRRIKERSILELPDLMSRFRAEAEQVGAVVYEAKDAEDACRYVAELARELGAELIVKSKSMLTEEIGLNHHLEGRGLKVVETDLGEWIIQLANQRPSHFTAPAIHLTRERIADLLSRQVGEKLEPDIEKLVRTARRELRQAFIDADMGISGANIAIAETGTIVIVSNEGNDRLVTTLPPVHVAFVGIEKIVPTMDDANTILKLLARCGTGQKATAYVSYITGPSRTTDIEKTLTLGVHGPGELHIVLVDNGREAMRGDEVCREAMYCLKCGACLNACPVYHSIGGHVYSNSYIGGIGSILTAFHESLQAAGETLGLCLGCRKCVEVCPSRIDIPHMILSLRSRLAQRSGLSLAERVEMAIVRRPEFMEALNDIIGPITRELAGPDGMIRRKTPLTRFRSVPALARRPLSDLLRIPASSHIFPGGREHGSNLRIAFFAGCLIQFIYPAIGLAVQKVCSAHGLDFVFSPGQACCGAPAVYAGDLDTARDLARRNVEILDTEGVDHIVTACPTCSVVLRHEFPGLLAGTALHARASSIASRTLEFTELLSRLENKGLTDQRDPGVHLAHVSPGISDPQDPDPVQLTYHDSCHLKRGLGIFEEPRKLLSAAGYKIVEMSESDVCCGFAGTYSFLYPDISAAILRRKIANISFTGCHIVATDCPGCILQIAGGLDIAGSRIVVRHTAQLLAERLIFP